MCDTAFYMLALDVARVAVRAVIHFTRSLKDSAAEKSYHAGSCLTAHQTVRVKVCAEDATE